MRNLGSNKKTCQGSLVLMAAGLAALFCIGLALAGETLFGDSSGKWVTIVIGTVAALFAGGAGCSRSCGRRKKPGPADDGADAMTNWPSS